MDCWGLFVFVFCLAETKYHKRDIIESTKELGEGMSSCCFVGQVWETWTENQSKEETKSNKTRQDKTKQKNLTMVSCGEIAVVVVVVIMVVIGCGSHGGDVSGGHGVCGSGDCYGDSSCGHDGGGYGFSGGGGGGLRRVYSQTGYRPEESIHKCLHTF